ncbi:arylesterase [Pigmentiphaga litoralis]|nr:arylesterase [Pigmentiphaga litoralis]
MIKPCPLPFADTAARSAPLRKGQSTTLLQRGLGRLMAICCLAIPAVLPATNAFAQTTGAAGGSAPVLMVLGDSLSAEYGIARGTGWVPLLDQRLKERKIDYRVVNASISGDTTSGGRSRLPALLKQHQPRLVIVELGANDALRGLALNMTEDNLNEIVSSSKRAGAQVVLVGMQIPPNYGRDYTQRFKDLFGKVADRQKVPLVPFLLEGVAQQPAMFQADRLHPLSSAQPTILENVWPTIAPLLTKK